MSLGLRFDCLGKGSVDTLGLGVELTLAGLNLRGIHLCYLFFRLVAMPCDRGLPANSSRVGPAPPRPPNTNARRRWILVDRHGMVFATIRQSVLEAG